MNIDNSDIKLLLNFIYLCPLHMLREWGIVLTFCTPLRNSEFMSLKLLGGVLHRLNGNLPILW